MASAAAKNISETENFELEYDSFAHNFQNMINWKEDKWQADLEVRSNFETTINSLKYSYNSIKPAINDTTVMMAIFKEGKLITCSERFWIQFLREIDIVSFFDNFYYVRNNSIIGIQFKDPQGKVLLLEQLNKFMAGFVINLEWFDSSSQVKMRVHWLPKGFYEEDLKIELSKFIEIEEFQREINKSEDNMSYPVNVISISGILRVENKEVIPHLSTFKGLQMLLVVAGRQPMCLRCEKIGHRAYYCNSYHCKDCKILHDKSFRCEKRTKRLETYAEKLKHFLQDKNKSMVKDWPTLAGNINLETRQNPESLDQQSLMRSSSWAARIGDMEEEVGKNVSLHIPPPQDLPDCLSNQDNVDTVKLGNDISTPLSDAKHAVNSEAMDYQTINIKRKNLSSIDGQKLSKIEKTNPRKQNTVATYGKLSQPVVSENLFDALAGDNKNLFE